MIEMLQTVNHAELILTTFNYPKALALNNFTDLEEKGVTLALDWEVALDELRQGLKADEVLVITGSLYFSAQVRDYVLNLEDES